VKQSKFFKVKENNMERAGKTCDRCGEGTFMAEHKNRRSCGKCGYTEFKIKKDKKP